MKLKEGICGHTIVGDRYENPGAEAAVQSSAVGTLARCVPPKRNSCQRSLGYQSSAAQGGRIATIDNSVGQRPP